MVTRSARAFTMVELLCAIAIIAVLAATLFPVLGMVREGSRRSACLSNLRQIGQGVAMYASDSDGIYPLARMAPPQRNLAGAQCYIDALHPYLRNSEIWHCPSADRAVNHEHFLAVGPEDLSLALSLSFAPEPTLGLANYRSQPISTSEVLSPAEFIVAGDSQPMVHETLSHNAWTISAPIACEAAIRQAAGVEPGGRGDILAFYRHSEASNYVFADGSARHLRPLATLSPNLMWYFDHRSLTKSLAAMGRGPGLVSSEDCLAIIAP